MFGGRFLGNLGHGFQGFPVRAHFTADEVTGATGAKVEPFADILGDPFGGMCLPILHRLRCGAGIDAPLAEEVRARPQRSPRRFVPTFEPVLGECFNLREEFLLNLPELVKLRTCQRIEGKRGESFPTEIGDCGRIGFSAGHRMPLCMLHERQRTIARSVFVGIDTDQVPALRAALLRKRWALIRINSPSGICAQSKMVGRDREGFSEPDHPPTRFEIVATLAESFAMTEIGFVHIRSPQNGKDTRPRRMLKLTGPEAFRTALKPWARSFGAGQELTFEGDSAAPVLFVLNGWLRISKSLDDGQRQIIDFVLPGDFVASASADGTASTLQIDALTDASVAVLSEIQWTKLQLDRPDLHWQTIHLWAAAQARLAERILRLGKGGAQMRIAYALLELCLRLKVTGASENCSFRLPLTQQQIGDFTGLSSVHVCRTMRKLIESGIISVSDHLVIRINDLTKLSKLAGADIQQLSREIMPKPV